MLGYALGVMLVILAASLAWPGVDWTTLGAAPSWTYPLIGGLVLANIALTGLLFWVVTRSFHAEPPIGLREMTTLIAVSGLLNYIPAIRAGLWGRAAYLKARHGLPLRASLAVLGVVLGLAVVVLGVVSLVLLLCPPVHRWLVVAGGLGGLTLATPMLGYWLLWRPTWMSWSWVPIRALDLGVTAWRLWLALFVFGYSASVAEVTLLASGALLVKLIGLTPNGLGLSEWIVVAMSAELTGIDPQHAAAAALVDRGIEVVVALIAGAAGAWWLRREVKTKHTR